MKFFALNAYDQKLLLLALYMKPYLQWNHFHIHLLEHFADGIFEEQNMSGKKYNIIFIKYVLNCERN